MDYCDVFISSHSDGTHSLHRIHGMLHFSKSDEETKMNPHLGWSKCFSRFSIWGELQIQNAMLWLSLHVLSSLIMLAVFFHSVM